MNPLTWLSIRFANGGREHDVNRLRALYLSLLRHVHISSENLSTRSMDDGGGMLFLRLMGLQRDNARIYGREDVAIAFRLLAASRSVAGSQNDEDVEMETLLTAQRIARRIEASVVRIIRDIGETVVYSERPRNSERTRDDFTFAYFCDKAILPLLVDVARALPAETEASKAFHGVVWSAKVKAQVLRTVNFLVSGVKDKTSLYFLLSHHSINHLILSFLPLSKWNDPALKEMLSAYAELLKTLSIQVGIGDTLI